MVLRRIKQNQRLARLDPHDSRTDSNSPQRTERLIQIKTAAAPTLIYEKALQDEGFFYIAGIDEAGRGAWAGPVCAAAVILPPEPEPRFFSDVRDSKTLTAAQRAELADLIRRGSAASAVAFASAGEIDRLGILNATKLAMIRAISGLAIHPDALLIDYVKLEAARCRQLNPAHGDRDSLSIAAASILAKTARDAWMESDADTAYPGYGFARHKGYGTRLHQDALKRLGASPIHRRSFAPIRRLCEERDVSQ